MVSEPCFLLVSRSNIFRVSLYLRCDGRYDVGHDTERDDHQLYGGGSYNDDGTIQPWASGSGSADNQAVASAAAAMASLTNQGSAWAAPSAMGLPVYSQSGFDLLGILARVATRPNPKIQLGPVDMTCAFVVVDQARYDAPIIYASPTFCTLTGYTESEVLGRNCRFLQAPDGRVQKGEERRYTAPDVVSLLRKCLSADKECQTSLVNYKKGGQAFINLVTVIPVPGGSGDNAEDRDTYRYQVGFQVDLTQQPNAILQRLKDGSYIVNYSSSAALQPTSGPTTRRSAPAAPLVPMSEDLRHLLADPAFIRSVPLTTSSNALASNERAEAYDDHQLLHMLLLEGLPDFVHVLSLKGVFLYAAPSVRRVLGYEPSELVGKSVADFCHPADLVPLMRELKESSSAPGGPTSTEATTSGVATGVQSVQAALAGTGSPPRVVDLLFRCRSKSGSYIWLDCRGRLHVEAGKGRKAIIMSGRQRAIPSLSWGQIDRAGGLTAAVPASVDSPAAGSSSDDVTPSSEDGSAAARQAPRPCEREFWAALGTNGTILFVGAGARDVLGWGAGELIGRPISELLGSTDQQADLSNALANASAQPETGTQTLLCRMRRRDGSVVESEVVVYPAVPPAMDSAFAGNGRGQYTTLLRGARATAPLLVQVRKARGYAPPPPQPLAHAPLEGLFVELETGRETSWQYELQQLKYANRRLTDQIEAIEAEASGRGLTAGSGSGESVESTEWRGTKRGRDDEEGRGGEVVDR